jgi:hypothetical protein
MKVRTSVAHFEDSLTGMTGGINLYRRGIDEFYVTHGFPRIYEELEALRSKLERIGMYERCRDALKQAEAWVRQGSEHDDKARTLLLEVGGELAHASGSYEALQRKYRAANDAPGGVGS